MKIAVLGANGFVGRSLANHFETRYNVVRATRQHTDLLSAEAVRNLLDQSYYDLVINAAAVMRDNTGIADTHNNLGIFMNFFAYPRFGKFINLASGAEYDRTRDINCADPTEILTHLPQDSYGCGQNIKSRLVLERNNFYNLRIFNCFGTGESSARLFPRLLSAGKTFEIRDDRFFDYFSIQDLCRVVESFAQNNFAVRDVNCVYEQKHRISEVADLFCTIKNINTTLEIVSTSTNNYTGSAAPLSSLGLALRGLEQGFKDYE